MGKKGQYFVVEIERQTFSGAAVARINRYVVFVPGGVPGDKLRIRLVERKENYGVGKIVEIIEPSPYRVEPVCPHFPKCGSCSWQMMRYDAQLREKEAILREFFEEKGLPKDTILPIEGMDLPWHYRNKAIYPLKRLKGKVLMGFYERNTHKIVDVEDCPIQYPKINLVASKARGLISKERITIYDEVRHWGKLRYMVVKGSKRTNEYLLTLVVKDTAISRSFARKFMGIDDSIVGVVEDINPKKGNTIFGPEYRTVEGRGYYIESFAGKKFRVSALSFFQTNVEQAEKLVKRIRETFEDDVGLMMDGYSGVGLFAITLADLAKRIVGVEESRSAYFDAVDNARRNDQMNVEFINAKVESVIGGIKAEVLILDPPRRGLDSSVISAIADVRPHRIFYISCNPKALVRDLDALLSFGYKIDFVQPFDFFPHTPQIETLVKLSA